MRPIYGLKKSGLKGILREEETQALVVRHGNLQNVVLWVNGMRLLSALVVEHVNALVGLEELRTQSEQINLPLLKWTLFKNGPVNFNISDYLLK